MRLTFGTASFNLLGLLRHRERGQAIVLVPLCMAIISGVTALAIDVGSFAADRRDLQNAADAIALAAAQDLPNSGAVQATANSWAAKNGINVADMTVTITQQNLPNVPNPTVKVAIQRSHSFTFARIVGITSSNASASATSFKTSPGGGTGLMPWSVLQSVLNGAPPGTSVTLKYDSNNVVTGNFGALRIDGNGASVYKNSIEHGSTNGLCATGVSGCPYPSTVQTEPGNMTGPTKTGTDYRISNTDSNCDTWAKAVSGSGSSYYVKPACNPFTKGGDPNSLRVIVVPVINSLCNGACTVTITSFALFYLEGYGAGGCTGNNCEIKGRFIASNTDFGAIVGVFDPNSFAHFVRLSQ
jgi:Flp pilus assembly protein TadG